MNNYYSEAYKDYYEKIRKRTIKNTKNLDKKISNSRDDIYPNMTNVRNYYYRRESYGMIKEKKRFRYIDRFILRLIITLILFLGAFTLKIMPNDEAKEIYTMCKSIVSSDDNYNKLIPNFDIDYKDILNSLQEKYSNIIKSMKLEDLNKALNL